MAHVSIRHRIWGSNQQVPGLSDQLIDSSHDPLPPGKDVPGPAWDPAGRLTTVYKFKFWTFPDPAPSRAGQRKIGTDSQPKYENGPDGVVTYWYLRELQPVIPLLPPVLLTGAFHLTLDLFLDGCPIKSVTPSDGYSEGQCAVRVDRDRGIAAKESLRRLSFVFGFNRWQPVPPFGSVDGSTLSVSAGTGGDALAVYDGATAAGIADPGGSNQGAEIWDALQLIRELLDYLAGRLPLAPRPGPGPDPPYVDLHRVRQFLERSMAAGSPFPLGPHEGPRIG